MGVDVDAYAGFGVMTDTDGVKEIIKTLDSKGILEFGGNYNRSEFFDEDGDFNDDYYINDLTDSMKIYDSVELSAYSGDAQFFGILVGEFDIHDEDGNLENSFEKMKQYTEQAQELSKLIDKPISFHVFTSWW